MNTKALAVAIAALFFLTLLTAALPADGSDPTDQQLAAPTKYPGGIEVKTANDLLNVNNNLGAKYYQTKNIVFESPPPFNVNGVIGSLTDPFTGTYNGNGYAIIGLDNYLFGSISNAEIIGVHISESGLSGIVQFSKDSTITNCSFSGRAAGAPIAAIAERTEIINCYNSGEVTQGNMAGIVGHAKESKIIGCYNTGKIAGSGPVCAGIVAYMEKSSIINCYNTGKITSVFGSGNAAGGIAGEIVNGNCKIVNCYNTGLISTSGSAGGAIVGRINNGTGTNVTITNCYALEEKIMSLPDKIVGVQHPSILNIDGTSTPERLTGQETGIKSLFDMTTSLSAATAGTSIYYTGKTTTDSGPVNGWDFDNVWTIRADLNDGLPILKFFLTAGTVDPPGGGDEDPDETVSSGFPWMLVNGILFIVFGLIIVAGGSKLPGVFVFVLGWLVTIWSWFK